MNYPGTSMAAVSHATAVDTDTPLMFPADPLISTLPLLILLNLHLTAALHPQSETNDEETREPTFELMLADKATHVPPYCETVSLSHIAMWLKLFPIPRFHDLRTTLIDFNECL